MDIDICKKVAGKIEYWTSTKCVVSETSSDIITIGADRLSEYQYKSAINNIHSKFTVWKGVVQYNAVIKPVTYLCFIVTEIDNLPLGGIKTILRSSDEFPSFVCFQFNPDVKTIEDIKSELESIPGKLLEFTQLKSTEFI